LTGDAKTILPLHGGESSYATTVSQLSVNALDHDRNSVFIDGASYITSGKSINRAITLFLGAIGGPPAV